MWAAGEQGFAEELEAAPPCCASLTVADLLFGADLGSESTHTGHASVAAIAGCVPLIPESCS